MRTRQEIKSIGKSRFTANYWPCVGALVLISVAIAAITGIFSGRAQTEMMEAAMSGDVEIVLKSSGGTMSSIGTVLVAIASAVLTVGANQFFIFNLLGRTGEINVVTPFTSAVQNFGRKLGGMLWMELFTFLWSLLFIIPGIIKALSYSLAPYILADCPNVKAKDALKLSMRIMSGHKWELFVFELSFIGWGILSGLTMGLLGVFYVNPYMESASACWYLEAREDALRRGVITMGQLEGAEPV